MGDFEYHKLLDSIRKYGFTDPVTVRPAGRGWELIDGEHRVRAASELGFGEIPFLNVGPISDDEAMALGIVMNELKGRHDPVQLGTILSDLLSRGSPENVLAGLPFTDEALEGLTNLKGFDWGTFGKKEKEPKPSPKKGMSWVERTFRLPHEANEVLDQALTKAKEDDEIEDWQALERIAADFLAS